MNSAIREHIVQVHVTQHSAGRSSPEEFPLQDMNRAEDDATALINRRPRIGDHRVAK